MEEEFFSGSGKREGCVGREDIFFISYQESIFIYYYASGQTLLYLMIVQQDFFKRK